MFRGFCVTLNWESFPQKIIVSGLTQTRIFPKIIQTKCFQKKMVVEFGGGGLFLWAVDWGSFLGFHLSSGGGVFFKKIEFGGGVFFKKYAFLGIFSFFSPKK